jgi:amidase
MYRISRRRILQLGGLAAAGPTLGGLSFRAAVAAAETETPSFRDLGPSWMLEVTIADLQEMMAKGGVTSRQLVDIYLDRIDAIDRHGPILNSIIELNPDARRIANVLDEERVHGHVRGAPRNSHSAQGQRRHR